MQNPWRWFRKKEAVILPRPGLYLNRDFQIVDEGSVIVSLAEARRRWESGVIRDWDTGLKMLVECNWDLDGYRTRCQHLEAQWRPAP